MQCRGEMVCNISYKHESLHIRLPPYQNQKAIVDIHIALIVTKMVVFALFSPINIGKITEFETSVE